MRWIMAAGLALGAALAGSAHDGGAEPLDEALLQLGSYDRVESLEFVASSRLFWRSEPCDLSAYRLSRFERETRMYKAMTRLAELPKAEQTELVRGALKHHLAVYSASLPEFLESWTAGLPGVIAKDVSYGIGTGTTGLGDSRDLLHWSRDAIHRLIVIAAAFKLTDLADEMDAIVRSAMDTRELLLSQWPPEHRSNYPWSSLYNSTLYDRTILAIGLCVGHEAARHPEILRSLPRGYTVVYVGRWREEENRRPMWRHHIAADGTVTPMQSTPANDTVIASFLFAECLSEDQFATLLAACGFEAAATP